MRFEANRFVLPRCAAAALLLAGCVGSLGVAAADPTPSPAPPSPSPAPAAKTTMDHDGTFVVGTDILPGIYSSGGPVGNGTCYWKRLGNPDGALIDNALSKKPQVVRIEPTDKAFKTDGCQPWQSTPDAAVPNEIPGPAAGSQLQTNLGTLNGLLGPNGMQVPQP